MPNVYLGPKFTGDQVIDACEKFGLQPRSMTRDEKIKIGAKYINEGKIIGWFQGRMEYGPRALGARSILASSRDNSINDSLNRRLNRTEFMPFAPVTTDKLAPLCFIGWEANHIASRFMTTCYQCTDLLQVRCPATVHVDNTARPQVVRYEDNRDYHDLIEEYYRISGNPALINTSFNHHEEPIVCSPEDAMRSFLKGNVDCLIIEDVLIVNHR
jgi:carbamoyltransferase